MTRDTHDPSEPETPSETMLVRIIGGEDGSPAGAGQWCRAEVVDLGGPEEEGAEATITTTGRVVRAYNPGPPRAVGTIMIAVPVEGGGYVMTS